MNEIIRDRNGINVVPINSRLLTFRKIFVTGEINEETACDFVRQVMLMNLEDQEKPIEVLINSPGGEVNSGQLMYDVIQQSIAPIKLYCIGKAYSMAAVLFASGNHGRYILPHSKLMLHEPLLGNPVGGNSSSIKSISESLIDSKRVLNEILAKHTGKSIEEIDQATSYDHYFNPKESIEFGLCDEIVGFDSLLKR